MSMGSEDFPPACGQKEESGSGKGERREREKGAKGKMKEGQGRMKEGEVGKGGVGRRDERTQKEGWEREEEG
jgi:hypothetical protein